MEFVITLSLLFLLLLSVAVALFALYSVYAMCSAAPFVPMSTQTVSEIVVHVAKRNPRVCMDLGSGDGRVLRALAPHSATVVGVEISPILIWWSMLVSSIQGHKNIIHRRTNLWQVDLADVDILVTFFLAPRMGKLQAKIMREMQPGSVVISYGFRFPDWQISEKHGKIYVYTVERPSMAQRN